jgi:peptidyl-prolyl cis-trans isomerase C
MQRYTVCLIFLVLLSISTVPHRACAEEKAKTPENAAVVNGQPIAYQDYALELDLFQRRMNAQGRPIAPEQMGRVRTELLNDLVNRELLYQESQKQGIKVSTEDVEKDLKALKERYPDPKQYEMILENMNMTEQQLKEQFARRSSIRALVDKQIASKVQVTEKEAKAFYENNPNFFEKPEQVRASHILIKVESDASEQQKAEARKKLLDIKKKVDSGDDFSELAKTHSEGPSNVKGGDLGYFSKGQMVPPFEQKAFSMKPNEVSDIVETQFGYHLIKVVDHKDAEKLAYDEVEQKIITNLRNQQIQQKLMAYLDDLRKAATIETFVE